MSDATAEQIKAQVAAHAAADPAFRAALLADPRAAIESWTGAAVPPQVKLRAVEEGPDEYVVVLPHFAGVGTDGELTDDDLEAVAGGSAKADRDMKKLGSVILLAGAMPVFGIGAAIDAKKPNGENWGKTEYKKASDKAGCVM